MPETPSANASLQDLGWRRFFEEQRAELDPELIVGRVSVGRREHYQLLTTDGTVRARLGGRLRHEALSPLDLPTVGDWVAATPSSRGHRAQVVHVFQRRTRFVRKVAGRRSEVQVVAANVDHVAVVTTPNNDFSIRRLERYLSAIRESGAEPAFVLNKADLGEDLTPYLDGFRSVSEDVPVLVTSALAAEGLEGLRALSGLGDTLVLVGSSGVGKSTIVNQLLGREVQRVGEIRDRDDRGRHVTSHRELFALPGGGMLMDTPGMRELQVWAFGDEEVAGFTDLEQLAQSCRFRDCQHHDEPGCAVLAAVEAGTLSADRLASYHKLQAELESQRQRQEATIRANPKRKWKPISRSIRKLYKNR